jgi:hypothetical protein
LTTFVIVALAGLGLTAPAAEPPAAPPPPNTLWRFLGIPQGCQKLHDALINKKGKHPKLERKPPLKSIADPANLDSPNPAIKAAAKIKTEEDFAPQKIKAIKYLATIGCGCYPGVREALLAALDDCTEEVRNEAAMAFCQAAGKPCAVCNNSGCCNAAVMTKLREMAHGEDAQGCPKESSARVRAAAENALNACRRVVPEAAEPKKEVPPEEPGKKETPPPAVPKTPPPAEVPEPTPGPAATSASAPGQGPTAGSAAVFRAGGQQVWIVADCAEDSDEESAERAPRLPLMGDTPASRIINPLGFSEISEGSQERAEASSGRASPGCPSGGSFYGCCPRCGRVHCVRPGEAVVPFAPGGAAPGGAAAPSAPGAAAPGEAAPGGAPGEAAAPAEGGLAGAYGAVSGPQAAAPNMIGDFFAGGSNRSTIVRHFVFQRLSFEEASGGFYTVGRPNSNPAFSTDTRVALHSFPSEQAVRVAQSQNPTFPITAINDSAASLGGPPNNFVPAGGTFLGGTTEEIYVSPDSFYTSQFDVAYVVDIPTPGAIVGRTKIAEDTSPIPQDRIIFDYGFFNEVSLFPAGVNVHRFTPGFEKTFFSGWMSFELKIPMAVTTDSTAVQDGTTDLSHAALGDMALTWKTLVIRREKLAISGGLTVAVPTADDTRVVLSDGTPLVSILNKAAHVAPFVGFLWTPNDRFFAQGFFQWDVEANPNPVYINRSGRGLEFVDYIHDTTLQFIDLGIGSWLYRGHERFRNLTGLAWTIEVHGNQSLKDADVVAVDNWRIGDFGNFNIWNLVVGSHLEFRDNTTLTVAYTTPLGGRDRQFNGELRLMLNRYFGASSRQRVPNI